MKNMGHRTQIILAIVGVLVVVGIVVGVVMTQSSASQLSGTAADLVITPSNPTLGWGQSLTLTVNAKSACNWFSSNEGYVSFSGDTTEVKTVVVNGGLPDTSSTIEARCGIFNTNHVTTMVKVAPMVRISPDAGVLAPNETKTFSTGDASCRWSISNSSTDGVLSLSPTSGSSTTVTGVRVGDAEVWAKCQYGEDYSTVLVR